MSQLRKIAKQAYRRFLALRAQPQLRRMAAAPAESSRLLAEALRETFAGSLTPDESRWVQQIEALRHRLDASQEPIEMLDFGAGNPDEARTENQMQAGKVHQVTVGDVSRISKYELWVLMLFKLIRNFRSQTCVELGTAVGISAAYQAAALTMNGAGTVITLEGAPALADLSAANLRGLGFANFEVVTGRFQDTLAGVLEQHQPIDFAFIDGHHDGKATLAYFDQIFPYLADRAVLVFDDIFFYASMRAAWESLEADPRVQIAVDLSRMGVCLIDKSMQAKTTYKTPMI